MAPDVTLAGCAGGLAFSHSSADSITSLSPQKTHGHDSSALLAATNFEPNDVMMNEVYISDDEETTVSQGASPASVPKSVFGCKPPASTALTSPSHSMSANMLRPGPTALMSASRPVSVISDMPPSAPTSFTSPRQPVSVAGNSPSHSMSVKMPQRASTALTSCSHSMNVNVPPPASAALISRSHPMSVFDNMPTPVQGCGSFGPPGYLSSFQQQPSGEAFSTMVPNVLSLPGGDLAHIESVLQEKPLLTEQVTALIVQQYPLYATNPLTLRFAVFHELLQLKKLREQQGLPAVQPLPSTDSAFNPRTSAHGADSSTGTISGTKFAENVRKTPVSTSSASSFVERNTDSGMKRPVETTVPHHSTSVWTNRATNRSIGGMYLSDIVGKSSSRNTNPPLSECSSSAFVGRYADGVMRRPAQMAVADSSTSTWTCSTTRPTSRDERNPWQVGSARDHGSARPGGNDADLLDSFPQTSASQSGMLTISNSQPDHIHTAAELSNH